MGPVFLHVGVRSYVTVGLNERGYCILKHLYYVIPIRYHVSSITITFRFIIKGIHCWNKIRTFGKRE